MTSSFPNEPRIIQGGMGIAVSDWRLARAVSSAGELGVVSGTALDAVLARRLGLGDPEGRLRRAMEAFPDRAMAERIWDRYYRPRAQRSFVSKPMPALRSSRPLTELTVVANFVEVWLAKEGHGGRVGINLLEKIQIPTLPSLLGAMLAGVDYVLMGAGIPRAIPGILDRFAAGEPAEQAIEVKGALPTDDFVLRLDPAELFSGGLPALRRPKFLPIVSSATLAATLAKRGSGRVDGFVVEGHTAGGHNAPPRGALSLDDHGEPIYGPRDEADLEAIRGLGLPFWLAGSYGAPGRLAEALALGAAGIQVGTAFAFCDEAGIDPELKRRVLADCRSGRISVFTDPFASPTGFPFKVAQVEGTLSDPRAASRRERICDLGYLRQAYRREDGTVGYRCPAEPIEDFLAKGGDPVETTGRKCVCNGLMATIGLGQSRKSGGEEPALVTAGDGLADLARLLRPDRDGYSAGDVLEALVRSS